MRRLLFLMSALLLVCMRPSFADTTWVAQGDVRGRWTSEGSPYVVMGHLQIISRDTLLIERGTKVFFSGPYRLFIYGVLDVQGSSDEPVYLTTDTTINHTGWGGLRFMPSPRVSVLSNGVIEYGRAADDGEYGLGGAAYCDAAQVTFNDCEIRFCQAGSGHAIYARNGSVVTLNRTWLFENGAEIGSGGALCMRMNSTLIANESVIESNHALYGGGATIDQSTATLTDCAFRKNDANIFGGGMFCSDATVTLTRCRFDGNGSIGGGAMDARSNVRLTMDHCLIVHNSATDHGAQGPGGGLVLQSGTQDVNNCTFVYNSAGNGGAVYGGGGLRMRNCIIARQMDGGGIYFPHPGTSVRYTCFSDNVDGDYLGGQTPYDFGRMSTVNANSDSCDRYFNIFLNPLFNDSAANDFELTADSPCIDAGDPSMLHDPDGSLPDLGAFPFITLSANPSIRILPQTASLHPAYPNPFNPSTSLTFDVLRAGAVTLKIYDLLGRETTTLLQSRLQPGEYAVSWNAADSPSGTYFAILESGGVRDSQKLLLMK